jgi:hypothetical protein
MTDAERFHTTPEIVQAARRNLSGMHTRPREPSAAPSRVRRGAAHARGGVGGVPSPFLCFGVGRGGRRMALGGEEHGRKEIRS